MSQESRGERPEAGGGEGRPASRDDARARVLRAVEESFDDGMEWAANLAERRAAEWAAVGPGTKDGAQEDALRELAGEIRTALEARRALRRP